MAQIRELKKRIGAVNTIARITKTMQMIATAKFTTALQRAKSTKPYATSIGDLVCRVVGNTEEIQSPFTKKWNVNRELVLLISSDRGLCGAYNGNVFRMAMGYIRKAEAFGKEVEIQTIGKKATSLLRFQKKDVSFHHNLGDTPTYEEVSRVAEKFLTDFSRGVYSSIKIVSMEFISTSKQQPKINQILPIEPSGGSIKQTGATYEMLPSSGDLIKTLLPLSVKTALFSAVNDALVSEQVMRMIAMKAATENANDLGRGLKRNFNRARQAQITTELTEIISGAAALG